MAPRRMPYDASSAPSRVQTVDALTPSWMNITYDPGPHTQPLPPPAPKFIDALGNPVEWPIIEDVPPEDDGDEPIIRPVDPTT